MRKLGGTFAAIVSAALIAGIAPANVASAAGAFDGMWSVAISTLNGNCPSSLRYPAQITNGRVGLASGEGGYAISGAVSGSGGIVVTVSQSGQTATGRGRLSRSTGGGKWRTADGQCSGTWVAERRS
jgi:hypothetical protein